jgi:hypothetical protein
LKDYTYFDGTEVKPVKPRLPVRQAYKGIMIIGEYPSAIMSPLRDFRKCSINSGKRLYKHKNMLYNTENM